MSHAVDHGEEIAFGPFRLDMRGRTLHRDGTVVQLGARSFDILCVLAALRGNLVTRDALSARVWPGMIVEPNTIHVHVAALRKALGDGSDGRRYIVTAPGQGYRFVGEIVQASLPALPQQPSVAVLPFQGLSGELDDYFADGVVEDIIAALARFSALFVIARNSSFAYKGRSVDIRQVGRELGVRYVLEGSVRRAANRVRITCQLIEAATRAHVWADRFDGALDDIFELQDQLTARVVGALAPQLQEAEIKRARRKPTQNLGAYDCYLRALASAAHRTQDGLSEALGLVARATELDPDFAAPHGLAAFCYASRKTNGWMLDRIWETEEAGRRARSAAQLGSEDAVALAFAAYALSYVDHQLEDAVVLVDRAVALNPNLAFAWLTSGLIRAYRPGEQDVGVEHVGRAMRLSPFDSHMHLMHAVLAFVHSVAGRHDEAVAWGERALAANPRMSATWRVVAANHAHAGRLAPARNAVARVLELDPGARLSNLEDRVGPQSPAFFASYLDGLRKAGLPE